MSGRSERVVLAPAAPRSGAPTGSEMRWRDQLWSYLPLLVLALLAGATWWLVKHTPVPDGPRAELPIRHEPDYVMNRFSVQHFTAAGRPRNVLEGRELRHYPDTDTLEIDEVRMRSVDEQGRVTLATADRALSSADGSEVQLFGGARVVREAHGAQDVAQNRRMEFSGEYLHVYTEQERVESHLPVTLRQGDMEVRGASLRYDHRKQVLELKGAVRGTLPPQR
ncbi:LPS export ABC transporter periplasmic protein LptC [Aquabacterium sp. A7-Y]|uniref:LPS export ABC transporter periplasmic protein LptC n=1 Tax=Aquabacterium sp. A7-Y TaxID=1349605 RepID=UPI00223D1C9E|nr:LPS export ABC transporter periplasmic protein LptC [Aquabacterium sp. A7-Y]MCW7538404.1 LPS export ABC transporter periplasmic protein LptC [Aquabacterium sp. A7-Y]